jgi:hypothetical protein
MKQIIVRYKVKPDRVAENERLVRAVYDELGRVAPPGYHYATFKLDDGVSFVHVSSNDSDNGQSPLNELAAFNEFTADIGERCDEPPVVTEMSEIGSYHLFSD